MNSYFALGYGTYYLTGVTGNTAANYAEATLAGLSFVTSTGTLSATTFSGALTGHASLDLPLTGGTMTGFLELSNQAIGRSSFGYLYWDTKGYAYLNSVNQYPDIKYLFNGTLQGMVYSDSSGFGLLDSDGNWAVQINPGINRGFAYRIM